jgi:flagellar hook-associated protein 3 FlgL
VRTSFVSTLVLNNSPMSATARIQSDMMRLNKEMSTGRMADVGLSLGALTGRAMSLHIDSDALTAFTNSNVTVAARLSETDSTLTQLATGASNFLTTLVSARDSTSSAGAVDSAASGAIAGFTSLMNTASGGDYIFGGINSGTAPVADFDSGPKAAIVAAFTAKFGFPPTDPQAAAIDAASMSDFLDNEFADLFSDANWNTTWSSASDQVMQNRISPGETIDSSVSANDPAFRKLAMAYAMVSAVGTSNLGDSARLALVGKAIDTLTDAQGALTTVQAGVGTAQNRVKAADDRIAAQKDILATRIDNLEGVDPAEAKVKVDTLTTQLEMSYSLTAKLLQLSIINYV